MKKIIFLLTILTLLVGCSTEVQVDSAVVEETEQEVRTRKENINLMKECITDAKEIIENKGLKDYQTDVINMAISLFEKRASHVVYYKEEKAKEKFDKNI